MEDELRKADLTENEAKIYHSMLELGPSNAGAIARKSGLHRRVVYDTLYRLIKKGLIGYIMQNGVRLFRASDPKRVLEIIKEKEEALLEIMPRMEALFNEKKEKEETSFYKGKNGLKTVFEEQINAGKEILVIGGSPLAYEVLQFYFKWYDKRRKEKHVKTRIIFHRTNKKFNVPYAEIRYLPAKYASPVAINIYGDKIALILWSKENPFAVVIKNKEIANGYRKYFELVWKSSSKG